MNFVLYHYYDEGIGPFRNLSTLSTLEAAKISEQFRREGTTFASKRSAEYMTIRKELEETAREQFIYKGGRPQNSYPHYMTVGECEWMKTWYRNPAWVTISWNELSEESISFTYGDLFPTMRFLDDKPYRRQVYTRDEIIALIEQYGLPQEWNEHGDRGPERYIEAQIWDEDVIKRFYEHKWDKHRNKPICHVKGGKNGPLPGNERVESRRCGAGV